MQAHPQKVWFVPNLGKIPENPGENGTQRCLISKNGAQGLQKPHEDLFWRSHQKKAFMIFVGEQLQVKVAQITFRASLGKCGQKIAPPKMCLLLHLWWKGNSAPRCPPFWKNRGGNAPLCLHFPASVCILFCTRSLYSL